MVLRLHGYSAWIESDGEPLEEYPLGTEGNVISCYVCSEEGKVNSESPVHDDPSPSLTRCAHKDFTLHFDDDGFNYISEERNTLYGRTINVQIDGSKVDTLWGDPEEVLTSDGMHVGNTVRPYFFAPVETTGLSAISSHND